MNGSVSRRVLILTYFFPPCNLPAAQRPWGWARYLADYGWRPIVVTRNWDQPVRRAEDVVRPSGTSVLHRVEPEFEAHYLPHAGSLRDRLYCRFADSPWRWISKPLTLFERVGQHFLDVATPFRYLYDFLRRYLRENPDVHDLIVTGQPFVLFKFGAALAAEFPRLRWIADYRDEWTTNQLDRETGVLARTFRALDRRSERRWLQSSAFVTSVSGYLTRTIAESVGRPGHTISNGYDFDALPDVDQASDVFTIVYNGTLYPSQPIEDVVSAVQRLGQRHPDLPILVRFPGLDFDPAQAARVRALFRDQEHQLEASPRVPRAEVIRIQKRAHVLLMLAHRGVRGVASSKIFEYLGLGRPVIVYPNDHDILEQLVAETGAGFVCDDALALDRDLETLAQQFLARRTTEITARPDRIAFYSRRRQTQRLAELLASDQHAAGVTST